MSLIRKCDLCGGEVPLKQTSARRNQGKVVDLVIITYIKGEAVDLCEECYGKQIKVITEK